MRLEYFHSAIQDYSVVWCVYVSIALKNISLLYDKEIKFVDISPKALDLLNWFWNFFIDRKPHNFWVSDINRKNRYRDFQFKREQKLICYISLAASSMLLFVYVTYVQLHVWTTWFKPSICRFFQCVHFIIDWKVL